ncbi:MAG: ArnT family glycosyltransferase [Candidatus Binatia bacterium]
MALSGFSEHFISVAVLGVVCGLVFFLFLGKSPFHDKGEPREALVVQDIVENGKWLFPLKLGQNIPSKPPLFHWVGAIASRIWGEMTEVTIRFPSALSATLGVFLIYCWGAKFYGRETGLLAGVMLATTVIYQTAAVEARVDMTLVFFITLPLSLFFGIHQRVMRSEGWWYAFYLTAGVGVLAKGPVNIILTGIIIAVFLALRSEWRFLARLLRHPGIVVGIASFAVWYGVALKRGGSDFAGLQFVKENLARFFVHGEGGSGHQKPIYYFLLYLLPLGFPWTMFFPLLLWQYFKKKWFADERALFLGIWIAAVFFFFSFSAGKRPPYILPLYPPLALLTALWCRRNGEQAAECPSAVKWIGWFTGGLGAIMLLVLLGHVIGMDIPSVLQLLNVRLRPKAALEVQMTQQILDERTWLVGSLLLASGVIWLSVARDLMRHKIKIAVVQIACLAVFTIVIVQGIVTPTLATVRSYDDFVQLAASTAGTRGELLLFGKGLNNSSIMFYGRPKIQLVTEDFDALRRRLKQTRDYVILGERQWKQLGADVSLFPPLLRSRGLGPSGDDPLVLIQGIRNR